MNEIFLLLGSNIGERISNLYDATKRLSNKELNTAGQTFSAAALANTDLAGTGQASSQAVTVGGGPTLPGNTQTFGAIGALTIADGPAPPPARTVYPGQTLAVQQVNLAASAAEDVRLDSYTVTSAGTAPAGTVSSVDLYLDTNNDGALDAGDTFLDSGGPFGGRVLAPLSLP